MKLGDIMCLLAGAVSIAAVIAVLVTGIVVIVVGV